MKTLRNKCITALGAAAIALSGLAGVQRPAVAAPQTHARSIQTFNYRLAPFGTVAVYRPASAPRGVILFLSGDGGWSPGVARMARTMAGQGAIVAGISTPVFLKALDSGRNCVNPNYALINLARDVQHRLGVPMYMKPIVMGYSAGATLAYASLAQGPEGAYKAAVSMGFSADVAGRNIWCKGGSLKATRIVQPEKGWLFAPSRALSSPWIVLQGEQDRVVDFAAARAFVARTPRARFIALPEVGHGFAPQARWVPKLVAQIAPMLAHTRALANAAGASSLPTDLPLNIVPAGSARRTDTMAVLYSGDGGWVGLDKAVSAQLARAGIPVVGMDSLSYFWSARTPAGAAADLDSVIRTYAQRWHKPKVLLVGYSFGADTLPYIVGHLAPDVRARVQRVSLLGLSPSADFQFHLSSWLDMDSANAYPTIPAIVRLRGLAVQCIRGVEEDDSACPTIPHGVAAQYVVAGGHHFDANAPLLSGIILRGLRT